MRSIFFLFVKFIRVLQIQGAGWWTDLRSLQVKSDIERMGGSVGKNFRLQGGAGFSYARGAKIRIGDNVRLADHAHVFVAEGAELEIEDGVFIGRGTVVAASRRVHLGSGSQIAHYVTVIDSDHRFSAADKRLAESGGVSAAIEIGRDVWIGANAVLLKGVTVGRGAVVGAGAVVTKAVPARTVATGNPVSFRKIEE